MGVQKMWVKEGDPKEVLVKKSGVTKWGKITIKYVLKKYKSVQISLRSNIIAFKYGCVQIRSHSNMVAFKYGCVQNLNIGHSTS